MNCAICQKDISSFPWVSHLQEHVPGYQSQTVEGEDGVYDSICPCGYTVRIQAWDEPRELVEQHFVEFTKHLQECQFNHPQDVVGAPQ